MTAHAQVIDMNERRARGPQLEDGFIQIANELFDAILRSRFTLRQQSVLLAIMRKTYGFRKKSDDLSASQIGEMCGMARNHVTETLNELASMGVIEKRPGEYGCVLSINKRYAEWRIGSGERSASPKSGRVPNQDAPSPELGQGLVPNRDRSVVPNWDTQKTTFQKTTPKDNSNNARSADRAESGKAAAEAFEQFWTAFAYKRGKARAVEVFKREYAKRPDAERDAWLQCVLAAAAKEAERRPHLIAEGRTPMFAQSWIAQARYEDEDLAGWGSYTPEQQSFIDTFNANIGESCPQVTEWTERSAARIDIAMRGKWDSVKWGEFWRFVRDECEFTWPISLDWLLDRDNFANVRGGKYQRGGE